MSPTLKEHPFWNGVLFKVFSLVCKSWPPAEWIYRKVGFPQRKVENWHCSLTQIRNGGSTHSSYCHQYAKIGFLQKKMHAENRPYSLTKIRWDGVLWSFEACHDFGVFTIMIILGNGWSSMIFGFSSWFWSLHLCQVLGATNVGVSICAQIAIYLVMCNWSNLVFLGITLLFRRCEASQHMFHKMLSFRKNVIKEFWQVMCIML